MITIREWVIRLLGLCVVLSIVSYSGVLARDGSKVRVPISAIPPGRAARATRVASPAAVSASAAAPLDRMSRAGYPHLPQLRSLETLRPVKAKMVLLQVYTGPLLHTWPLTMASCRLNPEIEWITVHIGELSDTPDLRWDINWAPNYQLAQATPEEAERWVHSKLGLNITVSLKRPGKWHREHSGRPVLNGYKWNDYKALYGVLFEDWIKGAEFWGYGDLDVVYGNIRAVLTDKYLASYDVISSAGRQRLTGPFSILRNTPRINKLAMTDKCGYETGHPWRDLLLDDVYKNYDEIGFAQCISSHNVRVNIGAELAGSGYSENDLECECGGARGGPHCVWSRGEASREDGIVVRGAKLSKSMLYIHFKGQKHRVGRSLRGQPLAALETMIRHGWYTTTYKHCHEGCGAFALPARKESS